MDATIFDGRGGNHHTHCAKVFEAPTGREAYRVLDIPERLPQMPKPHQIIDAAFSPDNLRLATLGFGYAEETGDYEVRITDCQTGKTQNAFERSPTHTIGNVSSLTFCAEGRRLVLARNGNKTGSGRLVEVCEADTGTTVFVVDDVRILPAVSRDGRLMATVNGNGQLVINLWETATGRRSGVIKRNGGITEIAFSPDGHFLAVSSFESLEVWDVVAQRRLSHFALRDFAAVTFSPDGKRLVTGSATGIITFWDAKSGQEALTLRGHEGAIQRLSFSPDGRFLVSSGADQVKIWKAAAAP